VKASDFDIGNYLNTQNVRELIGKDLRILAVRNETIQGKNKMVMSFTTADKALVVNKSNRTIMVAAFGNETNEWVDRKVQLHIHQVLFQRQMVASIAVEPVKEEQKTIIDADKPKKVKK